MLNNVLNFSVANTFCLWDLAYVRVWGNMSEKIHMLIHWLVYNIIIINEEVAYCFCYWNIHLVCFHSLCNIRLNAQKFFCSVSFFEHQMNLLYQKLFSSLIFITAKTENVITNIWVICPTPSHHWMERKTIMKPNCAKRMKNKEQ